ncbi:MAG: hypothetical protein K6E93_00010 [Bacteroidales bacterium]|nr:hypothetical protein [Bacteroidales bacterium]
MEYLLSFMRLGETRPCRLVAYLRHAWLYIWLPITTLRLRLSVVLLKQRVFDTPRHTAKING